MNQLLRALVLCACILAINCGITPQEDNKLTDLQKDFKTKVVSEVDNGPFNFLKRMFKYFEKEEGKQIKSSNMSISQQQHNSTSQRKRRQADPSYYGFDDFYTNDFLYDYYDWVCSEEACQLCNILTSECCDPTVNVNCFLPDSCLNNPCLSGGTCVTTRTINGDFPDFICVCLPGFTGKYCQLTNDFILAPALGGPGFDGGLGDLAKLNINNNQQGGPQPGYNFQGQPPSYNYQPQPPNFGKPPSPYGPSLGGPAPAPYGPSLGGPAPGPYGPSLGGPAPAQYGPSLGGPAPAPYGPTLGASPVRSNGPSSYGPSLGAPGPSPYGQQSLGSSGPAPYGPQPTFGSSGPASYGPQPSFGSSGPAPYGQQPPFRQGGPVSPFPLPGQVPQPSQPTYGGFQQGGPVSPFPLPGQVPQPSQPTYGGFQQGKPSGGYAKTLSAKSSGSWEGFDCNCQGKGYCAQVGSEDSVEPEFFCICNDNTYGSRCDEGFLNPCMDSSLKAKYAPIDRRIPGYYFVECRTNLPFIRKCENNKRFNPKTNMCQTVKRTSRPQTSLQQFQQQ